jgi:protein dithiol oxidoreductase (disulfide-forming)
MSIRKALALAASLFTLSFAAIAQGQLPYQVLNPPQPTEGGGKIEVVEFFWYGCPHCFSLEPEVVKWAKNAPKDVVFKRVPAYSNETWGQAAQLYYTLEAMGLVEQYHQKVFDAWHGENKNLANKRIREEWLKANNIDVAKYNEVEKSFSVVSKLQRAKQLSANYKVEGVPRVYVNGKYFTEPHQAGSYDRVFPVVDQLIATARKEQK